MANAEASRCHCPESPVLASWDFKNQPGHTYPSPLMNSSYIASTISRPASRLKDLVKVLLAILQCGLVVVQLLLQVGDLC